MLEHASDTSRPEADVARRLIVTGGESMNEWVEAGRWRGEGGGGVRGGGG